MQLTHIPLVTPPTFDCGCLWRYRPPTASLWLPAHVSAALTRRALRQANAAALSQASAGSSGGGLAQADAKAFAQAAGAGNAQALSQVGTTPQVIVHLAMPASQLGVTDGSDLMSAGLVHVDSTVTMNTLL